MKRFIYSLMRKLTILVVLCLFLTACQNRNIKHNTSLNTKSSKKITTTTTETTNLLNENFIDSHNVAITQKPWQFIQDNSSIKVPNNQRITLERNKILRNKSNFENITKRSEPYIYYLVNQINKNELPIELVLIPLIESAYDPLATSPSHSAGLWQFAKITAKEYGLERNTSYDARRDFIRSTNTAISMLQTINSRFNGDWLLTLAAYNAGEGRIRQAIKYNQSHGLSTDFWSLNLPKETMQYVPKFLAIIDIIKHNHLYNVNLPECNYQNSLVRLDLLTKISFEKIAKYTSIPIQDLKSFNAGYIKQTVNGPFHLLIPYVYAQELYNKLLAENLVNNQITDLIHDRAPEDNLIALNSINKKSSLTKEITLKNQVNKNKITYLVKAGDNIYSIAQNHRVKMDDILEWNNLKNAVIKEGDILTINVMDKNPI